MNSQVSARKNESLRETVDAFVGDAEQFDDLTMMCLEYGGPQSADPEWS